MQKKKKIRIKGEIAKISPKVLNPLNHAPGDRHHITIAELKALRVENDWAREPDRKFFLAYDFNAVDNWLYHDPEHYPIFGGGF